MQRIAGI